MTRDEPTVRPATPNEATTARSVLDAAMLETEGFDARMATDDVIVALAGDRVVGAAMLQPHYTRAGIHVEAVAVRPGRRGQGVGTALVEFVADRATPGPVTAEFEADARPFYESLGFSVRPVDDGRYRGVLHD